MTFRLACLAAIGSLLSLTGGASAGEPHAARAASEKAASSSDAGRALAQLVSRQAAESGLDRELQGYSLSPKLLQLRRYVEPGRKQLKVVCIVSIALKDPRDVLVAEVRGTASAIDGGAQAALEAASYAAVMRVPSALAKLRGAADSEIARR